MTTAAEKLATFGFTMDEAKAWVLQNLGNPSLILTVAGNAGITNAMLGEIAGWPGTPYTAADVKGFFQAYGLNSVTLDPANGTATVQSVNSATFAEGNGMVHTVFLASATTEDTLVPFSIDYGTASAADFQYTYFSNGVIQQGNAVRVPAGVSLFNFQVATADDTADEPNETYTVTFGGMAATGTITDNDEPAPAAGVSVLLNPYMEGWAPLLDLNDRTGELSNASMRAKVLVNAGLSAGYWALFDPARFQGSGDGLFTPDELGVSHLGNVAATAENIESLFYGTYFDIVQSMDFNEAVAISQFFFANLLGITTRNQAVMDQYAALFVDAEADAAATRLYQDSYYETMVTIGLQNLAGANNPLTNVFDSLMSI
ncbi:MAG: hypothetical protein HY854_19150 [Burkholderiales bacterium]|nr:hypothetical protein [Burkholderiales bacterium]